MSTDHPSQFALMAQRRFAPFFLDAVPRRRERQPVQVRVHRDGDLPAFGELDAARPLRLGHRRGLHPALRAVQRHLGPAGRQVRQARADAGDQELRAVHRRRRRLGLYAKEVPVLLGCIFLLGPAQHLVRAGEVRLPAAAPAARRADRRQRHGRDGHVRRDPARQRDPGGRSDRACREVGPALRGLRPACCLRWWAGAPLRRLHSRRRLPPTPGSRSTGTPSPRPGATSSSRTRAPGGLPLAAGHQLDVVLRSRVFLEPVPGLRASEVLHGNEQVASLLLVVFSVGVGDGRAAVRDAEPPRMVEIGLVPLGAIGMTLFSRRPLLRLASRCRRHRCADAQPAQLPGRSRQHCARAGRPVRCLQLCSPASTACRCTR